MPPNNADEVRIHLSASRVCKGYLDRHLVLTLECPDIQVGRMSRRNPDLRALSTNAWFDSPVMSRQHAMLHFDADQTKLFIQDTGSLHGTFQNGIRLTPSSLSQLRPYDELCFGTTVDRNTDTYPPCAMVVNFEFACTDRPQTNPVIYRVPDDSDVEEIGSSRGSRQTKPVVYRVPDDTDVEEISDDEEDDDFSMCSSIIALRLNQLKPRNELEMPNKPLPPTEMGTTDDCHAEKAPFVDEEVPEPPCLDCDMQRQCRDHRRERCDGDWQPSSPPTIQSVNDDQRDVGRHVELHSTERVEHVINDSDEWEDCSSSGRSRVPSPPLPSALPASWETEGLSNSTDSSCSGFCLNQVLPSISTSLPPPKGAEMERPRDADEREQSRVKETPNFCNPASTVVLGDRRDMTDTLPSLEGSRVLIPHSMRLPPLATTSIPPPHSLNAQTAAEALGEKTGKMEYFTARLQNRLTLAMAGKDLPEIGRPVVEARDEGGLMESMADKDEGGSLGVGSGPSSLFGLSVDSVVPLEDAPNNSLLASGEKFLSSPIIEHEAPVRAPEADELNETSAYQFVLSKTNAAIGTHEGAKNETATAKHVDATTKDEATVSDQGTNLVIRDLVEEGEKVVESKKGSRKRKAEEMSADLAHGGEAIARTTSASGTMATTEMDKDDLRAVKRLRLAAEVLGYAALGGVAVMSALIATAPTL
ncbi:hypothetical protein CP533_4168 [Ophiocordyceps camponoti-saundersi (nom. inval.)]|nr:hypothetical protein CP533_4168 [Ophiocordyceps camponoti-saundersi (nom. inval.)]